MTRRKTRAAQAARDETMYWSGYCDGRDETADHYREKIDVLLQVLEAERRRNEHLLTHMARQVALQPTPQIVVDVKALSHGATEGEQALSPRPA